MPPLCGTQTFSNSSRLYTTRTSALSADEVRLGVVADDVTGLGEAHARPDEVTLCAVAGAPEFTLVEGHRDDERDAGRDDCSASVRLFRRVTTPCMSSVAAYAVLNGQLPPPSYW